MGLFLGVKQHWEMSWGADRQPWCPFADEELPVPSVGGEHRADPPCSQPGAAPAWGISSGDAALILWGRGMGAQGQGSASTGEPWPPSAALHSEN